MLPTAPPAGPPPPHSPRMWGDALGFTMEATHSADRRQRGASNRRSRHRAPPQDMARACGTTEAPWPPAVADSSSRTCVESLHHQGSRTGATRAHTAPRSRRACPSIPPLPPSGQGSDPGQGYDLFRLPPGLERGIGCPAKATARPRDSVPGLGQGIRRIALPRLSISAALASASRGFSAPGSPHRPPLAAMASLAWGATASGGKNLVGRHGRGYQQQLVQPQRFRRGPCSLHVSQVRRIKGIHHRIRRFFIEIPPRTDRVSLFHQSDPVLLVLVMALTIQHEFCSNDLDHLAAGGLLNASAASGKHSFSSTRHLMSSPASSASSACLTRFSPGRPCRCGQWCRWNWPAPEAGPAPLLDPFRNNAPI